MIKIVFGIFIDNQWIDTVAISEQEDLAELKELLMEKHGYSSDIELKRLNSFTFKNYIK